ncbi:hypothetical protein E2C01_009463 [Portunus trituberculatus]|uniref:Uncharacterized protein n=1 Tax=Portunus trituberculatus TaxID=210409 RepID=A0A5B7D5V4_PORTR|nr:hypothetical protein [Portunus trituberculatus]
MSVARSLRSILSGWARVLWGELRVNVKEILGYGGVRSVIQELFGAHSETCEHENGFVAAPKRGTEKLGQGQQKVKQKDPLRSQSPSSSERVSQKIGINVWKMSSG